jgi:hypothetical protein
MLAFIAAIVRLIAAIILGRTRRLRRLGRLDWACGGGLGALGLPQGEVFGARRP